MAALRGSIALLLLAATTHCGVGATFNRLAGGKALAQVRIEPNVEAMIVGSVQPCTAWAIYSDGSRTDVTTSAQWASSNSAVLSVAGGILTALTPGTDVITATYQGTAGSLSVTAFASTLTSLVVTPPQATLGIGTTKQLIVTGIFANGTHQDLTNTVSWQVGNANTLQLATQPAGLVKALSVGATTVQASLNGQSATATITVTAATITSLNIAPSSATLAKSTQAQLTATAHFSDGHTQDVTTQVTWNSASPGVASVQVGGLVGGVAPGTSVVSASWNTLIANANVTVTDANMTTVALQVSSAQLAPGAPLQMTLTATFSDGTHQDITSQAIWTTSNANVLTSDANGLLTAQAPGTATVTVTLNGLAASATIQVSAATLAQMVVTPSNAAMVAQTSQVFTATGIYSDNSQHDVTSIVTWQSSNQTVAVASSAGSQPGLVTAVAPGSVTISATLSGVTGSTALAVSSSPIVSVAVSPTSATIPVRTQQSFIATANFANGSTQDVTAAASWSSSNANIVAIASSGSTPVKASALAAGNAILSASFGGFTGTSNVTVPTATLTSISVTASSFSAPMGTHPQMAATANYSDGSAVNVTQLVTWSSSNPNIATVSNASASAGAVTLMQVGNCTISATYDGNTTTVILTVNPAVLTALVINPNSVVVAAGQGVVVQAIGAYSDQSQHDVSSQCTWTSQNTNVVTVLTGANVQARGVATGSTQVTAQLQNFTVNANVVVTNAVLTGVLVTPANTSLAAGTRSSLTATATFSDGSTLTVNSNATWSSSNPNFAAVSNAGTGGPGGVVSALQQGNVTVSAVYQGKTGTASVAVTGATPVSLSLSPNVVIVISGQSQQYHAGCSFSNGTTQDVTSSVNWMVSNANIANVSMASGSQGLFSALAPGSVVLNANYAGLTATQAICLAASNATLCASGNADCGSLTTNDSCGQTRAIGSCGTCSSPNSTCSTNTCVCTPETNAAFCANANATCGSLTGKDNCGATRTVTCGTCGSPNFTCGSTNTCVCTPETDAAFCTNNNATCGSFTGTDNCGVARTAANCGTCSSPNFTCGSTNTCVVCTPETNAAFCANNRATCGGFTGTDNCGAARTVASCGTCASNSNCVANVCTCAPYTCGNYTNQCGSAMPDGCGGTINCSSNCTGGSYCNPNNVCSCPMYEALCNGTCISVSTDPNNCGGCGASSPNYVCTATKPYCTNGSCTGTCPSGLTACNGSCVDTGSSNTACGRCGTVCNPNQGCSNGHCVAATILHTPSQYASGCPQPNITDGGVYATCAGDLAQTTFRWAVCSCGDLNTTAVFSADGFDSSQAAYAPNGLGGGIGLNGNLITSANFSATGSIWSGASSGFDANSAVCISQDFHVKGPVNANHPLTVGGQMVGNACNPNAYPANAYAGGNITGRGNVAINGNLTVASGATVTGVNVNGAIMQGNTTFSPPCACDSNDLVPIAAIVAYRAVTNDDNSVGLDPNLMAGGGNVTRLDLPCGAYYLTAIHNTTNTTIYAHGYTQLYVGGNITANGILTFMLDPNAQFDLFVGGNVTATSQVNIGSVNYPALMRTYVHVGDPNTGAYMQVSANLALAGQLYTAPAPIVLSATSNFYGSLYTGSLTSTAPDNVHYDRAVLNVGGSCPAPTASCLTCADCGNQACINGACGQCVVDTDCCAPLRCMGGTCTLPSM